MTNPATARKLVLISVFGLLIIATYKGRTGTVPTSTRLWGTGWLAIMLGIAADLAPGVAGPFALLILAGSLTNGGDKAFTNLLSRAGGTGPQGVHAPGSHGTPTSGPPPKGPGGPVHPPSSGPPPKGPGGPVGQQGQGGQHQ